ncbi:hypothetical protein RZS08_61520, partial [Arthrospira platensis SPKY1]|nr:hypothetical protein [Arthrospira platensis SPKY1]
MNGLNATASVAVGFPLPDSTHVFTLSSLPDVIPGDTLWAYVHLGTPRDTVANLNLIKFDLDFTNTEFLEMTDTASSIRVGEWAS